MLETKNFFEIDLASQWKSGCTQKRIYLLAAWSYGMNQFIKNLSLSKKLYLLLLLPVLAVVWFAAGFMVQHAATVSQMRNLVQVTQLVDQISVLVNYLQQERGASGIYLSSKGSKMQQELAQIRLNTDKAASTFTAAANSAALVPAALLQDIANRSTLRSAVDNLTLTGTESGSRYTAVITALIAILHQVEQGIVSLEVDRSVAMLNHFSELKERAGRERAIVGAAFGQNSADAALLQRFNGNAGEFNAYLAMFKLSAGTAELAEFEQRMQHPSVAEVAKMKAQLLATPQGQAIGISSEIWFREATARINEMAELEHGLVNAIHELAENKYQQAYSALLLSIGILLVSVLVVVMVTYLIINNIKLAVSSVTGTLQQLSNRDLTASASYRGKDEFGAIALALNNMSNELKQVMAEIGSATSQVATAAEQASAVTLQTSKGMQQQLQDTEQVVTAMHEMSATVRDVASSTAEAAEMSRQVNQSAENGQQEVAATLSLIRELSEHTTKTAQTVDKVKNESQDITGVLDAIRGIAEQTNLLALNAAIEAARAGDQGRGFAVVASEVRVLAQRTQEATVDIQNMIQRLQAGADNAQQAMQVSLQQAKASVERVAQVGERLKDVNRDINAINDMNTQIASAAEEQNSVVEEINRNMTNINDVALQASAGAEQTAMTSRELARLAETLQQQVKSFQM